MRTRINNITFTPGTRSINTGITDLTIDDIRLFINESQMKVICSSMQKGNIDSISSGVVTYKDTFPVLASGDHITFEIDRGDDVAKKTDIPSVASIQNGLAKTTDLSNLAEKTDIPDDYAKPSDIPTVVQIQNGLAKTTDLPTDYAKAGTPTSGTAPTMVELGTAIAAIPTTTPSGWATPTNVSNAKEDIMGGGSGVGKSIKDVYTAIPTVSDIQNGLAKAGNGTNVTNTDIKNTLTDSTNGLAAIKSTIPSVANILNGLAPSTAVVDGNDTAISVIKGLNSEVGTSSDTTSETGTLFGIVKWAKDKVKDIYTALTNHVTEVQTTHPYAKEAQVKDGNDTAISVSKSVYGALTDNINGLSAIKNAIPTVADIQNGLATSSALSSVAIDAGNAAADAAAAKTAALAITGYATETNATANKNAIIAEIQANAGVPTLTIPDSTAAQELAPNVLYIFATRTSTLTLTLGTPIVGIANEYHFFVICGSTAPTINFPADITWNGGSAPTIAADKTYEISILNNVAAYFKV